MEDGVLPVLQGDVVGLQDPWTSSAALSKLVAGEVATLTERVDVVSVSAERAQRFLAGMQALMASVMADEPLPVTAPLTTTVAPTATPPCSTATVPLTITTPITPRRAENLVAPDRSPPITATAPVTPDVQAPLTATLELAPTLRPTATVAPATTPAPATNAIRGVVFLDSDRSGVRSPDLNLASPTCLLRCTPGTAARSPAPPPTSAAIRIRRS